jgi:ABC-2 type transport system permease protein
MLGTLRRIAVSPIPLGVFLAGRLVFVAMVLGSIALVAMSVARWIANVPVSNLPAAALWLTFTGTALFLLFLVLLLHASTQRTASMLGNMVIFPLAMLGGSFFPFEIMPQWMAAIGRLTPNGWALVQFKAILSGSANAAALATVFGGLIAVSAAAYLLALRRLRGGFLL